MQTPPEVETVRNSLFQEKRALGSKLATLNTELGSITRSKGRFSQDYRDKLAEVTELRQQMSRIQQDLSELPIDEGDIDVLYNQVKRLRHAAGRVIRDHGFRTEGHTEECQCSLCCLRGIVRDDKPKKPPTLTPVSGSKRKRKAHKTSR